MNKDIKCYNLNCTGNQRDLQYVCRSIEYHSLDSMPDEDGDCDLLAVENSHNDDCFDPYIRCNKCGRDFRLDGSELK